MRLFKVLMAIVFGPLFMILAVSLGGLGMLLCFSLGIACCATIIGIPVGIILFGAGIGCPLGCGLGAVMGVLQTLLGLESRPIKDAKEAV